MTAASDRRSGARDRAASTDSDGTERDEHGEGVERLDRRRLDRHAAGGVDEPAQIRRVPRERAEPDGGHEDHDRDRGDQMRATGGPRPRRVAAITATIPATGDARNASPAADPGRRPPARRRALRRADGGPGGERQQRDPQLARHGGRDIAERRGRRGREQEVAAVVAEPALEPQEAGRGRGRVGARGGDDRGGPGGLDPSDPAAGDRQDGGPRRRRGAQLELDRKEPGAGGEGGQHHGLDGDEGGRHREPAGRHDERGQRVLEPRIGVGHVGVDPAGRLPAAHQLADPALVPEDVGVAGRVVVARDEPGGRRDDEAGGGDRDGRRRHRTPSEPQRRAPRRPRTPRTTTRSARSAHGSPTIETPASGWSMTSQAAAARHRMPTPTRSAAGAGPRSGRSGDPDQPDRARRWPRRLRRPLPGRPSSRPY